MRSRTPGPAYCGGFTRSPARCRCDQLDAALRPLRAEQHLAGGPLAVGLASGWKREKRKDLVHTQPAALAFASERTQSELARVGYASVFPIATVAKIVIAQLLLAWLT